MRANKSKFKKNAAVEIRDWTGKKSESGVITSVIPIPATTSTGEQFTLYRYMVLMNNARGPFGASQRFVYEHQVQALIEATRKAA